MVDVNSLSTLKKKLYYKIIEVQEEFERENELYTSDDILEELKVNKKYPAEYARMPKKLLKSMIDDLLPSMITPKFTDKPELGRGPNLMNKSLPFMKKKNSTKSAGSERKTEDGSFEGDDDRDILESIGKKLKKDHLPAVPEKKVFFSDFGGIEDIIKEITDLIIIPIKYSHMFKYIGVQFPKGILLCGSPGSGKTTLGMAICNEMGRPFRKINGTEIVSGMSGESESKIRDIFNEMKENAPSILFIDEIDTIASKKDNAPKDMEKRIVSQLLTCIDDIANHDVCIIGATNRPESLDPGLRRSGRFDKEITLSIPNDKARLQILQAKTKETRLEDINLEEIAKLTPGYVGADLEALVKEAGLLAVKRLLNFYGEPAFAELSEETKEKCWIKTEDFEIALKKIQPTAKREGFSVIPGTTWEDIGALSHLREELESSICMPIKNPEKFKAYNTNPPAGVLLYGPPGCGKTLLAKAVANESRANFISIKGPELLNKYVGESERAIRELFRRARSSAPCVVFFDELDSICPKRGSDSNQVTERVVNQLLTELDGMEDRKNVFMIAATNRPDIIDDAMLRPGRLDKLLYVPIPTESDRASILKALIRKSPISDDVNVEEITKDIRCEGFTGADLGSLVKEAAMYSMKREAADRKIAQQDFFNAFNKVAPSVSLKDKHVYEDLQKNLRNSKNILREKPE